MHLSAGAKLVTQGCFLDFFGTQATLISPNEMITCCGADLVHNLFFVIAMLFLSSEVKTKEINKAEGCYSVFAVQLISALAEAPLSLVFYTNPSEYVHKIKLTAAKGVVYEQDIGINDLESIRKYITRDRHGAIVYAANAPEKFMGCLRPEPVELKSIIDEFDMSEGLYLFRGGLLSCISLAASLSERVSVYNEFGADHLKSNENEFIIISLAAMLLYQGTKNRLFYIFSDSNALASFLSVTVRYYGNQSKQLDISDISKMVILAMPVIVGSSYAGIKHNNYVLKTIILLTPVIIDRILSWPVLLYNIWQKPDAAQ
ncbi:hypothetical protein [Endozoicomonas sp. 2B-B]